MGEKWGLKMNLHHLEWFCHAYETCSFAKAAERAFVSRQAFGKAVRALEDEVGGPLFKRDAAGVKPTELAQLIYPKAQICLKDLRSLVQTCDEYFAGKRQKIRIALADGIAVALPDDFFESLERENPYVEFSLEKHFAGRCLDMLEKGSVDFALCSGPLRNDALNNIPLVRHATYVAVSKQLVDFSAEECTLKDLESLMFFSLGDDFPSDQALAQIFISHGLTMRANSQYKDYDVILKEVRHGRGATIVPTNCLDQIAGGDIVLVPFPGGLHRWEIDFVFLEREYSDIERRLIDFMRAKSELVHT